MVRSSRIAAKKVAFSLFFLYAPKCSVTLRRLIRAEEWCMLVSDNGCGTVMTMDFYLLSSVIKAEELDVSIMEIGK